MIIMGTKNITNRGSLTISLNIFLKGPPRPKELYRIMRSVDMEEIRDLI